MPRTTPIPARPVFLKDWIGSGVLEQEAQPNVYAYFQTFTAPDSGQVMERKGFIGLGAVEDYSAGVVHRHEQTLSGPKKDRMELLRHTHAHFGQIFMLYPDPELAIDQILDQAAETTPVMALTDEYGVTNRALENFRSGGDRADSIADGRQEAPDRRRAPSL